MADLAKLVVKLEAETAKYQKELDKAKRQLDSFSVFSEKSFNKLKSAALIGGTAVVGALTAVTAQAIRTADDFNQMAQRTGESTEALSALAYAAKLSNVDLEALDASLVRLAKSQADATKKGSAQARAFEALGVSAANADGSLRSSTEVMLDIAESFAGLEDGAGKSAIAVELFGRSGAQLIPFLNQGAAGIHELMQEAQRLGVVISSETAQAADAFGDNLDRLKAAASGVGVELASRLLPELVKLTDSLVDMIKSGDGAQRFADQITTGFKLIVSFAASVYQVFDRIGTRLGSLAAAAVAFARGDWTEAKDIIVQSTKDIQEDQRRHNEFIEKLWSDRTATVIDNTKKADEALKQSIAFGTKTGAVQGIEIFGASRKELSAMEQFYAELNELTRTQEENQIASFNAQREALNALWESGLISAQTYNARLEEAQDELLPAVEITAKRMTDVIEKQTAELSEFQKEAMRNTQDIIADSLINGFDEGISGVIKSFGDMLVQLSAQAVAADLAGRIFGKDGKGGGWLSAIAGLFGAPSRDSGGRGMPGQAYRIGTGAQPEMFVPDRPGRFIPRDEWMGGMKMSNTFVIQTPTGRIPLDTQQQIATRTAQALARAQRRNS